MNPLQVLILCPTCRGTGRNPEAPAELVDDDDTCLTCCLPCHPWYARRHGQVWTPVVELVRHLLGPDRRG